MQEKDITYWKNNCEENYITTPISVLRYISELEKIIEAAQQNHKQEILSAYKEGQRLRFNDNLNFMAEQYYNETYK